MTGGRAGALAAGAFATAAAWEAIGRSGIFGPTWAPLSAVFAWALAPGHVALLGAALARTGGEAATGLAIGSAAGVALAALAVLVPRLGPGLRALASIVNGIPVIAVAGVCVLTVPRGATPAVVAALAVGFIVFVATAAGLDAAPAAQRDVFAVFGAARRTTFARLLMPAALPAVLDGLRAAAPSAVVGAIVGEWFASDEGVGPLLLAAMQNYAIAQLWAAALAGALLAIVAYALLGSVRALIAERFA